MGGTAGHGQETKTHEALYTPSSLNRRGLTWTRRVPQLGRQPGVVGYTAADLRPAQAAGVG